MKRIVIFGLGSELYGMDIYELQEIIRMVEITRIPKAPSFIEGVINLRGKVIPIIDLKKKFGIVGDENSSERRIIVANIGEQKAGLIVDHVSEVTTVRDEDIEQPPAVLGLESRFISGLAKLGERIVILLKADEILNAMEKKELKNLSEEETNDEASQNI
ncbi:Chemotaxis protein CheW [Fervidicola ferrireducens]|uniref:Chemotaxis protein CheW n=1 Tax=Fervidicola ferrireducens TaxID=520764 RepID=A0A140LCV1_9FIRM|nr:chemotaxis protein CheW [Fervidicola ferrireducens]KXG78376.1 Chemotaxis protein CheW [Fervidicola ferrireducens]